MYKNKKDLPVEGRILLQGMDQYIKVVEHLIALGKLNKTSEEKSFTVIVPNHKEIALGTFQSIIKQAAMTKEE